MVEKTGVSNRVKQLLAVWGLVTMLIMTAACSKKYTSPLPPPPGAPTEPGGQPPHVVQAPTPTPAPISRPPISQEVGGDEDLYGEDSIVRYGPAPSNPGSTPVDPSRPPVGEPPVVTEGPVDEGPYDYSTAANDDLYQRIQAQIDAEPDSGRRIGDRNFANKIQMASFFYDRVNRDAELLVDIETGRGVKRITFTGALDRQMHFRSRSHDGRNEMRADVVCMDLAGTCQTVHVRVTEIKSSNHTHVAHVIVRTTNASIFIEGNGPGIANNPNYDRFLQILLNTVRSPGRRVNVLRSLVVTTSEVVGGSSQFAIAMTMPWQPRAHQIHITETIIWRGPLMKPRASDRMSLAIDHSRGTIIAPANNSTLILNSISESKLVRNDGRGNLQLLLTIGRAHAGAYEDNLRLTISRVMKPVGRVVLR